MSDWKDNYNLLGWGGLTSLVTNVKVSLWGNEVLIECVYNPEERLPYRLAFKDCRDISWTVHDEEAVGEQEAEFFGISLGEPEHRKPAVITTDICEISILYGSFSIHKGKNLNSEIAEANLERWLWSHKGQQSCSNLKAPRGRKSAKRFLILYPGK